MKTIFIFGILCILISNACFSSQLIASDDSDRTNDGKYSEINPVEPDSNIQLHRQSVKRIHFEVSYVFSATGAGNDIANAFSLSGFGGTRDNYFYETICPEKESDISFFEIQCLYSIIKYLRAGFLYMPSLSRHEVSGRSGEDEKVWGSSMALILEFVPRPAASHHSIVEFAAGLGLSYNDLHTEGDIFPIWACGVSLTEEYSDEFNNEIWWFETKKNGYGALFYCSLDFYCTKNISLRIKVRAHSLPKVKIPALSSLFNTDTRSYAPREQTLREHTIYMSSLDFGFGMVLHL